MGKGGEMRVTMVDHTSDAERKIAKFAAICYDSPKDEVSLDKRIKHLMKVKHLATLRFANATFLIEGVSRVATHQLVRHPHLSYLQESQRYVSQTNTEFVVPSKVDDNDRKFIGSLYRNMAKAYDILVANGVKKEDARYILPNGAASQLYITGNFQAWYDFLVNRLDSHAQLEVRTVASCILEELKVVAPNVFAKLGGEVE